MNNETMNEAYERTRTEVAHLMGWIGCELQKYDDDNNASWGTQGNLAHVRENLAETVAFLSGMTIEEIKENLAETVQS